MLQTEHHEIWTAEDQVHTRWSKAYQDNNPLLFRDWSMHNKISWLCCLRCLLNVKFLKLYCCFIISCETLLISFLILVFWSRGTFDSWRDSFTIVQNSPGHLIMCIQRVSSKSGTFPTVSYLSFWIIYYFDQYLKTSPREIVVLQSILVLQTTIDISKDFCFKPLYFLTF